MTYLQFFVMVRIELSNQLYKGGICKVRKDISVEIAKRQNKIDNQWIMVDLQGFETHIQIVFI